MLFQKSSIASAVLIFCSITSAHAATDWQGGDLIVTDSQEYADINIGDYKLNNSGNLSADKVTVVGGGFVNTGKINANYISLKANTSSGGRQVTLGGEIVATEQFAYYGSGHNQYNTPLTAKLTTKHLLIDSHGAPEGQVGLSVPKISDGMAV